MESLWKTCRGGEWGRRWAGWPGSGVVRDGWPGSGVVRDGWLGSGVVRDGWPGSGVVWVDWLGSGVVRDGWPGSDVAAVGAGRGSCAGRAGWLSFREKKHLTSYAKAY